MNGKQWLHRVHDLPCVLCQMLGEEQSTPTQAHHVRDGQGKAQRASDFLTVALCVDHHLGRRGIHGDRSALRQAKVDELALLAATIEAMN